VSEACGADITDAMNERGLRSSWDSRSV
jgi:hypothetical protein